MRLYSLTGASAVADGDHRYEAGKDGGFDFPDELSARLHPVAVAGRKQWETDVERQHRLIAEELQRRQSPEALYEAVSQLVKVAETAKATAEPVAKQAPDAKPEPKPVAKAAPAKAAEK
jgi:hypothetical protein